LVYILTIPITGHKSLTGEGIDMIVHSQKDGLIVFTELRDAEYSTRSEAIERLGELFGSDPTPDVIERIVDQTDTGYSLRQFEFY
jgi:hypothetical protein